MEKDIKYEFLTKNSYFVSFSLDYFPLCRVIHHQIHEADGKFQISGGRLHASIAELVRYHTKSKSGMLTLLRWPHKREPGRGPFVWPHVTVDQMKRETTKLLSAELVTNVSSFLFSY